MSWTKHSSKLGGIRQTPGSLHNIVIWLKRRVQLLRTASYMAYIAETWKLTKQAQNKRAAAHTKMGISMLNITYMDIKTTIWVIERTQVMNIISNVINHRSHQPPQRRPMDLVSQLGGHATRKYYR